MRLKQLSRDRRPPKPRVAALAGLAALFLFGLASSQLVVARATTAAEVSLRLWPAGQGRIEATQGGQNVLAQPCDFTAVLARGAASECPATITVGAPVTLKAVAEPQATVPPDRTDEMPDFPVSDPRFVRWSKSECGTDATCTFTPDADSDGEWITAVFTPLQLQVGVFGTGTLTFRGSDGSVVLPQCPADVGFGDKTCHARLPADIDVVIEASIAPTGWGIGCEPEGGSSTSRLCTLGMSNLRTLAFVSFDGQAPLDPPFRLTPIVKVKLTGSGQGRVSGDKIDCPSTCQIALDYQQRVRLVAQESPGSTFVGWVGVCSTDRTCVFNAGSATGIQARFDAVTPPTTTTPTTTTSTGATTTGTTTTATTSTSTTATSVTTTTTTTTTTTPRPKPRLGAVFVRGHGSKRVVAFVVIIDRRGRATARLLKQGKMRVSRGYALAKGRNALRLKVPRRVKAGQYRLSVRVVVSGGAHTVAKTVRIPR